MLPSATDLWETPQDFFDALDSEFHFKLDVCSTPDNAKCSNYYTKEEDGLLQNWCGHGAIWCNPPYGRELNKWVKKAYETAQQGETVVMLLPARTDTKWFHEYIYGKAKIRFIKGRLKVGGNKNAAPFPSMVIIFKGGT